MINNGPHVHGCQLAPDHPGECLSPTPHQFGPAGCEHCAEHSEGDQMNQNNAVPHVHGCERDPFHGGQCVTDPAAAGAADEAVRRGREYIPRSEHTWPADAWRPGGNPKWCDGQHEPWSEHHRVLAEECLPALQDRNGGEIRSDGHSVALAIEQPAGGSDVAVLLSTTSDSRTVTTAMSVVECRTWAARLLEAADMADGDR